MKSVILFNSWKDLLKAISMRSFVKLKVSYLSTATAAKVLTEALTATPCRYGATLHNRAPNHHSEKDKHKYYWHIIVINYVKMHPLGVILTSRWTTVTSRYCPVSKCYKIPSYICHLNIFQSPNATKFQHTSDLWILSSLQMFITFNTHLG